MDPARDPRWIPRACDGGLLFWEYERGACAWVDWFQARRAGTSSAEVEGPGCRCKVKSERPGGPTHRIYYATHGHLLVCCVSPPGLMNANLYGSISLIA